MAMNLAVVVTFVILHHSQGVGGILRVRLTGGSRPSQGTVEVWRRGEWGAICQQDWHQYQAATVCRQLGYKGPKFLSAVRSFYGAWEGKVHLKEVYCYDIYTDLGRCDKKYTHWCDSSGVVGVDCQPDQDALNDVEVRLVDKLTPNIGGVEVKYRGEWGTVCGSYTLGNWDYTESDWACKKLGFTGLSMPLTDRFLKGNRKIWHSDLDCPHNMTSFGECVFRPWGNAECHQDTMVGVMCGLDPQSPGEGLPIRLTDGPDNRTGLVQVYRYGIWLPLCQNDLSFFGAKLICKKLGYPYGGRYAWMKFGMYRGPDDGKFVGSAWDAQIWYNGSETSFEECVRGEWKVKRCDWDRVWIQCWDEPYPTDPIINSTTTGLISGNMLVLSCESEIRNQGARLDWDCPNWQNGYAQKKGNSMVAVHYLAVARYMNNQTCECRAWAESGWSSNVNQTITVMYGPGEIEVKFPEEIRINRSILYRGTKLRDIERSQEAVDINHNVTVTCLVHNTNPVSTLRWYIGSKQLEPETPVNITSDDTGGFNMIQSITVPVDMALVSKGIICEALNEKTNQTQSNKMKPFVNASSILSVETVYKKRINGSETVELTCYLPSPFRGRAVWRDKQDTIVSNQTTYTIDVLRERDLGVYTCRIRGKRFSSISSVNIRPPDHQ